MLLDPYVNIGPGTNNYFFILQPGVGYKGTVSGYGNSGLTSEKSNSSSHIMTNALPQLFVSSTTLEYVKEHGGPDISSLLGKEIGYDRNFTFNGNDIPWK